MKKYFLAFSVLFCLGLTVIECGAQTVYTYTDVGFSPTRQFVDGLTRTSLDYWAGLRYDPAVLGELYRRDISEIPLDKGYDVGWADIFAAEVYLYSTNYVPGKTYCTNGVHFIIDYVTGQRYVVKRYYPCITIPIPPTPTPTPTPTPCDPIASVPCHTPTPTPTPTPTSTPTVGLSEVGFTGDRKIRRFEEQGQPYIDEPDGSTATWRRNNNPDFPVAYKKGTSPTLFAKLTISPPAVTAQNVQIRIIYRNAVVTSTINVPLLGNEVRVDGISIPFSNLESGEFIKKGEYTFRWEISFDNGSNWIRIGNEDSKHDIHWLNAGDPPDESEFKPFKDFFNVAYRGLFDKALEWSTGKVKNNEPDFNKVIQRINSKVAERINYSPG